MHIHGVVNGMRQVTGKWKEGSKKAGQNWYFLSLEVKDFTVGETCSCQLRDDNPVYKEYVEVKGDVHTLIATKDLTGHEVKMVVNRVTSGERSLLMQVVKAPGAEGEKSIRYEPTPIVGVRYTVANIKDIRNLYEEAS